MVKISSQDGYARIAAVLLLLAILAFFGTVHEPGPDAPHSAKQRSARAPRMGSNCEPPEPKLPMAAEQPDAWLAAWQHAGCEGSAAPPPSRRLVPAAR